jgi:carboxypeptidase C (cathepsin A)
MGYMTSPTLPKIHSHHHVSFHLRSLGTLQITKYILTGADMNGFLAQQWVQVALGVPVNYTGASYVVGEAFAAIGDFCRPGSLEAVSYLLDRGVKVHMMYGDRDFVCNWIGGERVSLAINYKNTENFHAAGYSPIVSEVGIGGMVRQYGNFSFSRVYQAGHEGIVKAPSD